MNTLVENGVSSGGLCDKEWREVQAVLSRLISEVSGHFPLLIAQSSVSKSFCTFSDTSTVTQSDNYSNYRTNEEDETVESVFDGHCSTESSDDEFEGMLLNSCEVTDENIENVDELVTDVHKAEQNYKIIQHEYDDLPNIEELRIHIEEDIAMEELGKIVNIVDRLVLIAADSKIALDFDSVVFDIERNSIGQIYDIFGPVSKPMYAILFNTAKEANECTVGSIVYFAPTAESFTHPVFIDNLKKQKVVDNCWDGEGDCPDELLAFSDDEQEKSYKVKRPQKRADGMNGEEGPLPASTKKSKARKRQRYNAKSFAEKSEKGSSLQSGFLQNEHRTFPVSQSRYVADPHTLRNRRQSPDDVHYSSHFPTNVAWCRPMISPFRNPLSNSRFFHSPSINPFNFNRNPSQGQWNPNFRPQ